MKHIKALAFFILFFAANTITAQTTLDKWPAIKTFHEVLSQTYHSSEKGDLEPIKTKSKELALKAQSVNQSEIPAAFKTKEISHSTIQLQMKAWAVHKLVVSKASDADITKSLVELHEIFHKIVGLCAEIK